MEDIVPSPVRCKQIAPLFQKSVFMINEDGFVQRRTLLDFSVHDAKSWVAAPTISEMMSVANRLEHRESFNGYIGGKWLDRLLGQGDLSPVNVWALVIQKQLEDGEIEIERER